jgi:hypothetical protein
MWDSIGEEGTAEKVREVMIPAHFYYSSFLRYFDLPKYFYHMLS